MLRVFEIDTDVLYQWRNLVPTYETKITKIGNIHVKNIHSRSADAICDLKGDPRLPVRNVFVENVKVDTVRNFISHLSNVYNYHENNDRAQIFLKNK